MPFVQRLVSRVVDRPWLGLGGAALVVVLLAWPAGSVPTDNSLGAWFVEDDPALVAYRDFLRTFGNDEAVVVAYRPSGSGPLGLDDATLRLQERTVVALESVEGVESVLGGAPLARTVGPAAAVPVLERLGLAESGAAGPEGAGGRDPVAALLVRLEASPDMDARRGAILDEIAAALDTTLVEAGHDPRRAGIGVLYEGLNRQTERDGAAFLLLAVLIMALLLWLILGSLVAVLLTLVPPLAATVATVGLVGWTGGSLNVVMATLPALILVLGIADGVHIFLAWYRARGERPAADVAERRALARDVVGRLAVPCLLTSLTTGLGFLALASSRMAVIRELALYAAAGVLLVWALAVVGIGAGLALLDVRPPRRSAAARLSARLALLGGLLDRRRGGVIVAFVAMLMVMGAGLGRVVVDTHTLGLLPADHEVVEDSRWIEEHLGAYTPLEFVVEAEPGAGVESVLEPAVLERVARWQASMEAMDGVERTLGITTLFALAGDSVPGSAAAAEETLESLLAVTGDEVSAYLTDDRTATRVTAFVPMGTAREFAATVRALEAAGERALGDVGTVRATGYLPLYVRIIDYTVSSTLFGLALAFGGVFLVLGLLLRSARLVLAAIPPNLFVVVAVFGVMGWADIPLDIATATVGAIVLGIAVDDTVHLLHRYRLGGGVPAALAKAGPGMLLTSLVLVIGLSVLLGAGSLSVVYFGLLIILAVTAALAADLLLLPVLLSLLAPSHPERNLR